ncbi:DUF45 domain-containing protein [Epidermidibacterium keratini]|uniref:DUF45 domain-containing protein n=1 Tax=Epidermidibacterium keratini TaxID=1891644 RepID=A0A7L4YR61_9ACTN|nr:M48 family metallopeptidase [Epidermidibacterium keratini]QHC01610.1 DUF45 domain-containing protein [Epidermidibacterium keratini]
MGAKRVSTSELVIDGHRVEVRASARRRRSVQAYRDGDRIVVLLPAALSQREAREWTAKMVARVVAKEGSSRRQPPSDDGLARRAAELSEQYLEGRAKPRTVRWVTNQNSRWGSCTPSTGTIRLSHRLQAMPPWVVDYVLVHELSHLLVAAHNASFWAWVGRYPHTERARGFLDGVSLAPQLERAWAGSAGPAQPQLPLTGPDDGDLEDDVLEA